MTKTVVKEMKDLRKWCHDRTPFLLHLDISSSNQIYAVIVCICDTFISKPVWTLTCVTGKSGRILRTKLVN